MKNKENKIIVILSVILIILCGLWTFMRLKDVSMQNKLKDAQAEYNTAQKTYDNALKEAEMKYVNQGAGNQNTIVSSVSSQKNNYKIMKQMCNKFFKVYDTFNNNQSYLARKNQLKNMMTDGVANSGLFDQGKDVSGHSMVSALQLTMTFQNLNVYLKNYDNGTINALVNVNYQASSNGNDPQNGQQIFYVTYNKQQQKFTNIQLLQMSGMNTALNQ